jgi:plasmid stabilization system protein ParE
MKYSLFITEEARNETLSAYLWYEDKLLTLGNDFLNELEECYEKLTASPLTYGFLKKSEILRFTLLDRFPYIVIYLITTNRVTVVSVRHTSRQPYL